jgi:gas vesicle protein
MKGRSMMSFVGGALAGAAAMYLMDPETGERRRRMIAAQADDYLEGTKEALHSGWDRVADYTGDLGHTITEKAQRYGSQLSDLAQDKASDWNDRAQDAAGGWFSRGGKTLRRYGRQAQNYVPSTSQISDNLSDYSKSLWKQIRGTGGDVSYQAKKQARSYLGESSPVVPVTLTAIGCCAVGAGIMYIIDPRLGRARRAWLMDKSRSIVNRTGKSFYRTGRHMANKTKGVVAETRGAAEDLAERVQSSLQGILSDPRVVRVTSDLNGTITLMGRLAADQYDRVLRMAESVPGVCAVVNRLERMGSSDTTSSQRNKGVPQM